MTGLQVRAAVDCSLQGKIKTDPSEKCDTADIFIIFKHSFRSCRTET